MISLWAILCRVQDWKKNDWSISMGTTLSYLYPEGVSVHRTPGKQGCVSHPGGNGRQPRRVPSPVYIEFSEIPYRSKITVQAFRDAIQGPGSPWRFTLFSSLKIALHPPSLNFPNLPAECAKLIWTCSPLPDNLNSPQTLHCKMFGEYQTFRWWSICRTLPLIYASPDIFQNSPDMSVESGEFRVLCLPAPMYYMIMVHK